MTNKELLRNLKSLNYDNANVSLAIVKEYKRERISHYDVKYVPIDKKLEKRLRSVIISHVSKSKSVDEYNYDCPEPEEDFVRSIKSEETDFYRIFEKLKKLNPEEDIIENVEELVQAKAYMIVIRNRGGIRLVGFRTLPENWKMKKSKGLINLLFKENRFEDLQEENVFSIANNIDILYFDEMLFILSKKGFENGLNFREGMINNASKLYEEVTALKLFVNLELLQTKVGNNQRQLRKIATIRNLGHYRDSSFLLKLRQISEEKGWRIAFDNGQIIISEDTWEDILTLLQNKRLHSELTDQDFDVDSVKPLIQ